VLEKEIAQPLNMALEEAAHAVLLIQSVNIEHGIRAVSLEKGYDPREFTLVSFGGASGLLVGNVAQQLSIPKVLIPIQGSVFSAVGLLMADIRRARSMTRITPAKNVNLTLVNEVFSKLENEVKEALVREGGALQNTTIQKSCDLRYIGQAYEVNVAFPDYSATIDAGIIDKTVTRFHGEHRKRFGHAAEDEPVEFVCFRVLGILPVREISFPKGKDFEKTALKGQREAYFGKERGFINCSVYERENMSAGSQIKGPAIIEDPATTIVVYPDNTAVLDEMGNVVLNITQ
jgi:N-methylhydantoinase A